MGLMPMNIELPEGQHPHETGLGWLREDRPSYLSLMLIIGLACNALAFAIVLAILVLTLVMR
jgi:hypothetical protein